MVLLILALVLLLLLLFGGLAVFVAELFLAGLLAVLVAAVTAVVQTHSRP
jgi:hypothetical protein